MKEREDTEDKETPSGEAWILDPFTHTKKKRQPSAQSESSLSKPHCHPRHHLPSKTIPCMLKEPRNFDTHPMIPYAQGA